MTSDLKSAVQNQLPSEQQTAGANPPWRPFLIGNRMRTTSEDSAESFDAYDIESPSTAERRFSITERFFGSAPRRERRVSATEFELNNSGAGTGITKNIDLKQFMKRQRNILGDDEWQ